MSDDDDLAREIREQSLPDEHPTATEVQPEAPARTSGRGAPKGRSSLVSAIVIAVVLLGLGAGVTFLLVGTGASDAFVYSKLVDEVMREPDRYVGRELRVEGQLREGSVVFVAEPECEHTFVLEREGLTMPVRFPRCVVPDTFRDDMPMDVVVQGQLGANGTFHANQVIPRCPSKYEMRQRQESGEEMPHGMPGQTS
jgi:cytochrome c-type biogenesis protein CcmE